MPKISIQTIINFKKKAIEFLRSFFKSEGFKIGAIIFLCLFGITTILPDFLDNSKLKFDLSQRLSKLTQSTVSIKGDLSIQLLPSPSISIKDVFIENYAPHNKRSSSDNFYNIYIKNLKIVFPILKINNRQLIKKIIIKDSIIEIAQPEILSKIESSPFNDILKTISKNSPEKTLVSNGGLSSQIFSIDDMESTTLGLSTNPSVELDDAKIIFYNESGISKEFNDIQSTILYNDDLVEGFGTFNSQGIENIFKIFANFDEKNKKESYFSINSPVFNLKINGKFLEKNLNGLAKTKFNGFLECDISELKNFYKSLISNSDLLSSKLRYNGNSIKFSSEFYNDGKNINLKKAIITSILANGYGDIYLGIADKIFTADFDLDFDNLDVDNIWSTENPAKKIIEKTTTNKLIENAKEGADKTISGDQANPSAVTFKSKVINVKKRNVSDLILETRDYDINLEIFIKKATLYEGVVEDIKLYANIANDKKIFISPLSFKIAGNSEFRASGIFEESENASKFIGSLDGKGDSLGAVLKWLKIDSENIKFDNLKNYSLYADVETTPTSIGLKNFYVNLDDKKTEFYGNIALNDLEKLRSITSDIKFSEFNFDKYISLSKNNSYLNEGILFDKLLWLNQVYSDYFIKLKFDKLLYNNQEFNNQNIEMSLGQGYIKIPKTHFVSDKNIFDFEFNIDIGNKNQIGNLSLNADKLSLKIRDDKNKGGLSIFDNFYKIPSLQGFSGKIDLTAKEIALDDKTILDFDYKNSIKNGVFGQSKLSMKIYDGEFEYKGLCDIKYNKIINGIFLCKSCNLNKIFNDFYNVKTIDGIVNLSGDVVSIAKSVNEFKSKFTSEINMAISAPSITGYGLNDLINKMSSAKTFVNDLLEPEKIIENNEALTKFTQAKGAININGERASTFSFKLSAPSVNSTFSGSLDLNEESINGTLNTIFLSGSAEKKIPINIATNVFGFFDDVGHLSNLNQARQFLGLQRIENQELNNKLESQSAEKRALKRKKIITESFKENNLELPENNDTKTENKILNESKIIDDAKIIETKSEKAPQENLQENPLKETTKESDIIPKNIIEIESENSKIVQPSF
jgi:hypothetical protein